MPFRRFRSRLSSTISQESNLSRDTDEQNSGRGSFEPHPPAIPKIKAVNTIGLIGDSRYHRDSGGSVRFGDRTLWVWRDTQTLHPRTGRPQAESLLSSTASWSDHAADGSPAFLNEFQRMHDQPRSELVLKHYGDHNSDKAYFRIIHDGCEPRAGVHKDGTRRAMWPASPPLVTSSSPSGRVIAYSWIQKTHIRDDKSVVTPCPATTLYRIIHVPCKDKHTLPHTSVIDGSFWNEDEVPYGTNGAVLRDGIAYLFARVGVDVIAVARVLVDLIERKACYEYWVDGEWTKAKPSIADPSINVTNASAGGRGTYFWSEAWQSFVWIGGSATPGANCYITTASSPTGPWIQPFKFFSGADGTHPLRAQSIQAHPSLLKAGQEEGGMYISYTQCNVGNKDDLLYSTHLLYVEWEDDDSSE